MPTIVFVPAQLSVEHLLAAVKQLPPTELQDFTQQFTAWQAQPHPLADEEARLLAEIQENAHLPATQHRRYEQLRHRCERQTLSARELAEYQALLAQLEARNVKRIEALTALAQRRGTTLRQVIADLDLHDATNAE